MIELTEQDFENGFKDVEVDHRTGKKETIRLKALDYRQASDLVSRALKERDPWIVVLPCLPPECQDAAFLNKLSPLSTSPLVSLAWGLTCGLEFLKSLEIAGGLLIQAKGN
jgi:hypothetical protein